MDENKQNQIPVLESTPPPTTPSVESSQIVIKPKGSSLKSKWPFLVIAVLLVLVGIFGGYFILNQTRNTPSPTPTPDQKACSQEAKIRPDGSGVGRTGPNCEFAACPKNNESSSSETADWETYADSDFGINLMYPKSYGSIVVRTTIPTGKLLEGSVNKAFVFGSYIKPNKESGGRGGSLYDLYKVTISNGKYYWSMWFNPSSKQELEPVKIIKSKDGSEILILNNNSFVEIRGNEYKYLPEGEIAAFVNLKGSKYTALVFINSPYINGEPAVPIPEPEFYKILETLEIN